MINVCFLLSFVMWFWKSGTIHKIWHDNHDNHTCYHLMNYNLEKKEFDILSIIDYNAILELLKKWHDSKFDNNHNDHNYVTI